VSCLLAVDITLPITILCTAPKLCIYTPVGPARLNVVRLSLTYSFTLFRHISFIYPTPQCTIKSKLLYTSMYVFVYVLFYLHYNSRRFVISSGYISTNI
jgi:hypothetical protein